MHTWLRRWIVLPTLVSAGLLAASWAHAQDIADLTDADVLEAIRWGMDGDPRPYPLQLVTADDDTALVLGAVYTPFLRIALAARAAREAGQPFDETDVTPRMREPLLYVALRWHEGRPDQLDAVPFQVHVVPVVEAGAGANAQPPVWVTEDVSLLDSFGGGLTFDDVAVVAAYPLTTLRSDVVFQIARWDRTPSGRMVGSTSRGRIRPDDLASWR